MGDLARLSKEVEKIVQAPEFRQKTEQQGAFTSYMDPKTFGEFTKSELQRWQAVVKSAGIKAD